MPSRSCRETNDSRHDQLLSAGRPDHGPQGVGKRVAKPGVFSKYRQAVSYTAAAMGPAPVPEGELARCPGRAPGGRMGNWVITDRYHVIGSCGDALSTSVLCSSH